MKRALHISHHLKGGDTVVKPEVTIYVDGSCRGQGLDTAKSGWAFVIEGDVQLKRRGKVPGYVHDSNRAEAFALLEAMRWVDLHPEVTVNIRTDSSLLISGFSSKKVRSLNPDIWEELGELLEQHAGRIRSVVWIPSAENLADGLAKEAAIAFIILDDDGTNVEFGMRPVAN